MSHSKLIDVSALWKGSIINANVMFSCFVEHRGLTPISFAGSNQAPSLLWESNERYGLSSSLKKKKNVCGCIIYWNVNCWVVSCWIFPLSCSKNVVKPLEMWMVPQGCAEPRLPIYLCEPRWKVQEPLYCPQVGLREYQQWLSLDFLSSKT